MIEKTLVLLKPDCIPRGICGEILQRFEKTGLKIVGMKMVWIDEVLAKKHYFDVAQRRGESVLKRNVDFLLEGPVIAICFEGVHAIEHVRKMIGSTESKAALPGTIRGDYSHHSYEYTDKKGICIKNIVHASANKKDADYELALWFRPEELHDYHTVHEKHVF